MLWTARVAVGVRMLSFKRQEVRAGFPFACAKVGRDALRIRGGVGCSGRLLAEVERRTMSWPALSPHGWPMLDGANLC